MEQEISETLDNEEQESREEQTSTQNLTKFCQSYIPQPYPAPLMLSAYLIVLDQLYVQFSVLKSCVYNQLKLSQITIAEINREVLGLSLNKPRMNPKSPISLGDNHFSGNT
eukprot:snap_masked-scaffold_50-processed-gene-1.71-mRNA-1 protein AED:1.00 eAED:1.00 QI:0/0/0/0/1/1/2/0/110